MSVSIIGLLVFLLGILGGCTNAVIPDVAAPKIEQVEQGDIPLGDLYEVLDNPGAFLGGPEAGEIL